MVVATRAARSNMDDTRPYLWAVWAPPPMIPRPQRVGML